MSTRKCPKCDHDFILKTEASFKFDVGPREKVNSKSHEFYTCTNKDCDYCGKTLHYDNDLKKWILSEEK